MVFKIFLKSFFFVSMASQNFSCQKNIIQLNILINIMNTLSYDMDYDVKFLAFQKSNTLW